MGIRKPTITTAGYSRELATALEPVKQSVEMITGARLGMSEIKGLPQGTTSSALIGKVNEIIARINVSGTAPLQRATTDSALDDVGVQPKKFNSTVSELEASLATVDAKADTNASSIEAVKSAYLPLAGGTMTGTIRWADDVGSIAPDRGLLISGGKSWTTGAYLVLRSESSSVTPGCFQLYAQKGTTCKSLSGSTDGNLTWGGAFKATTLQATSDARLKKDIHRRKASLDGVFAYQYRFKDDEKQEVHVGLLAQEVKEVLPEAVIEDDKGFYSLDYNAVVATLVEEVHRLRQEVNQLKLERIV